jgi:hypothetical protein
VPASDTRTLRDMGVLDVFPTGTPLDDVVRRVTDHVAGQRAGQPGPVTTTPASTSAATRRSS